MWLKLSKAQDTNLTNEVMGIVTIESNQPMEDDMDLRVCLEFGRRDHFMLSRRRRYAFYGDPAGENFTDFTIATEKGSTANLTAYNWWCSKPFDDKESRYDFYEYTPSLYL